MAQNYVMDGNVLEHTATADIASGDVVVAEKRVGVALVDIANGATGSVQVTGVFALTKASAGAIAQGALVYATSAGVITTTASGNTLAGYAWSAAADGETTVEVKLNA